MTYTLRIATDEDRDLVVAALRTAADQRTRVARQAAGKVAEQKRAGRDVRSSAVKVTNLLAEADTLDSLAAEVEALEELAIVSPAPADPGAIAVLEADGRVVEVDPDGTERVVRDADPATVPDGDGTSKAAQDLAAAAGLKDAILLEDGVDTGAIAEDEADDDDVEDVLG